MAAVAAAVIAFLEDAITSADHEGGRGSGGGKSIAVGEAPTADDAASAAFFGMDEWHDHEDNDDDDGAEDDEQVWWDEGGQRHGEDDTAVAACRGTKRPFGQVGVEEEQQLHGRGGHKEEEEEEEEEELRRAIELSRRDAETWEAAERAAEAREACAAIEAAKAAEAREALGALDEVSMPAEATRARQPAGGLVGSSGGEWACAACTLLNPSDATRCSVCDAIRGGTLPAAAALAAEQQAARRPQRRNQQQAQPEQGPMARYVKREDPGPAARHG